MFKAICRNAYNNWICDIICDDVEELHQIARGVQNCVSYEIPSTDGSYHGCWDWNPELEPFHAQAWAKRK